MGGPLEEQLHAWRRRIDDGGSLSGEDLLALRDVLAEASMASRQNAELIECLDDLEARFWKIDNSRFLRMVRWPGRMSLRWRGRLEQLLLRSPLRPVFEHTRARDRAYQLWISREQNATPARSWFEERDRQFQWRPVCSLLMPVRDPRRPWLEAAIESLRRQYYPDWELCICDEASAAPWVAGCLEQAAAADPRIRFVRASRRLGAVGALNLAAGLGTGDYLAWLGCDDVLPPYALHYVAAALQDTDADLIYSDEDRLDDAGRRVEPLFKPAWSPDLLLGCMYLGRLFFFKRSRFEEAGAFRPEMDGSPDHDLALRLSDRPAVVRHVPRILCHRRKSGWFPPAPLARVAVRRALAETLERRGLDAVAEDGVRNTCRVRRSVSAAGRASLVICSRHEPLAVRCLRAIRRLTDYDNREVLLVQHGVNMRLRGLDCKALYYEGEFNFARINNLAARMAHGDWLVFLNDDIVPLRPEWLTALAGHVARPEVGVVGATLLYSSGAIQDAGIATGMMGGAGHPLRGTFGSPYWNWLHLARNVSAVTGACLAVRRRVFEELGGFDEKFPMNFNDVDLCLRARGLGYEVICEPSALLRHDECRTRAPGVRWREYRRFRAKWPDLRAGEDPFYSPHLHTEREDALLRLDEPLSPEPNAR